MYDEEVSQVMASETKKWKIHIHIHIPVIHLICFL